MTSISLPLEFAQYPAEAANLLLYGSVGRDHLTRIAGAMLSGMGAVPPAERTVLGHTARDIFLSAWTESPLDGEMALLLAQTKLPRDSALPGSIIDLLAAYRQFWQPPIAAHPFHAVVGPAHALDRAEVVRESGQREPRNLFWKAEAWKLGIVHGLWDAARVCLLAPDWPRTLAPVRFLAQAQCHLALGNAEAALSCLTEAQGFFPGAPELVLRGECLLRLGRREEALDAWTRCLRVAPWRTNLVLRAYDCATGRCDRAELPPESVALLLYSYNKAEELAETLASLAASDTGAARIWVLDNGSTDNTSEVLDSWRTSLEDRLTVVRMPVNIGAPAARNWLLALPEVRAHTFVAFIDDDVRLPADWLRRLGAAVAADPEASVWGCRVVDAYSPLTLQCVDYTPLAPQENGRLLHLPNLHAGSFPLADFGQFSYLRSCVSVTGCCHLLRTADIDRTGSFDIRFSPSQCDDIERDLRVNIQGGHVCYQGHLSIEHKRRSGQAVERSAMDMGNATANTHKLETKHSLETFQSLHEHGLALLRKDLHAKQCWLNANSVGSV